MYMSEAEEQAALVELLLRCHALVMRINSGRRGRIAFNRWASEPGITHTSGITDLIAVMPEGEVWFIECKTSHGVVADAQDQFRSEIERRGGHWMTSSQAFHKLEAG
jgi:hypothetical protein